MTRLKYLGHLGVWFLAGLVLPSDTADTSWEPSIVQTKLGGDVLAHCLLKGVGAMSVVRLFRTVGQNQYPIADNGNVKQSFASTGRYYVKYEYHDMIVSVTLHISGVHGEDSGDIGCYVLGSSQIANLAVKVDVPITELYILARHPDGSEYAVEGRHSVTLTEGVYNVLSCVAFINGSIAPLTMTVTIGGKDETKVFTPLQDVHAIDMLNGFQSKASWLTLSYTTTEPLGRFNGQHLICNVSKTEDGTESQHAEIDLNVIYKPKISCSKAQYIAVLNKPFTISCEVWSNPGSKIEWFGANETVVKDGDGVHLQQEALSADHTRLLLLVDRVFENQSLEYILMATNDVGSSEIHISIYVDGLSPPTTTTSTTSTLVTVKADRIKIADAQAATSDAMKNLCAVYHSFLLLMLLSAIVRLNI